MSSRSQAIERMEAATLSERYVAAAHYDALLAAGFEILGPGELHQVGWLPGDEVENDEYGYVTTHKFGVKCQWGDKGHKQCVPIYVRTDGGDAS